MKKSRELTQKEIMLYQKIQQKDITKAHIKKIYKDQLRKFDNIGIGGLTENGVEVTAKLIRTTERRLQQLRGRVV